MKKITALLLVVLMLAAMSIAVFARYEVCPECHGRMREYTESRLVKYVTCPISGDPSMKDAKMQDYVVLECTSCTYSEEAKDGAPYTVCNH